MKKITIFLLLFFTTIIVRAQVGINTTIPNAQLDIRSSSQATPNNTDGILIPKVDVFPATNPTAAQQGMLVYLTTTSGTNLPGFYYWDNSGTPSWKPIVGSSVGTLDQAYDFGGAGNGKTITADTGAVLINGTDGLISTGTLNSGSVLPISGAGTKLFWYPRKAAFRAGNVLGTFWDDDNIGNSSVAIGNNTLASAFASVAIGNFVAAHGLGSSAFGTSSIANGQASTVLGRQNVANGNESTAFGYHNFSNSYGETVLGIGATTYSVTANGATHFRATNVTDRLFTIGNALDANNNTFVDVSERSDAMIVLKNGLTRLPSTTNTMIDAADGKAVITKEYLQSNTSGTLDQAYDFGGVGNGKTITADNGAVFINGTDGLISTGTFNSGSTLPISGMGVKMFWYPRKAAFRAGQLTISLSQWDDINIGSVSTAFGNNTIASGTISSAFGNETTASGTVSTAFGSETTASGERSTVFGRLNTASSYCETVIGIGATTYTPSTNGEFQFRTSNATDRLFVIGNALDTNSNGTVDTTERSDAMVVLKNGNIGIGTSTPLRKMQISDNSTSTINGQLYLEQQGTGDALIHIGTTGARHFNLGLDTSADSFKIGTSATTATAVTTGTLMTVQATGEVGIGTATPAEKLHVSGPAGLTAVRIANTSGTGATSNVALDFFRNTAVNTDWRIYNIGANLTLGNSGDDLATVNDLYQFQGSRFIPMTDGTLNLGFSTNKWNTVFALNGTINTSDANQKKNINNINYGLNSVMQLRPVSFEWKIDDGSGTKLGLIAQELQQIIPEVVRDWDWKEDENGKLVKISSPVLGVYYSDLIPVLIKSIQEQQAIIDMQKKELNEQKSLLESVLQRLALLEQK